MASALGCMEGAAASPCVLYLLHYCPTLSRSDMEESDLLSVDLGGGKVRRGIRSDQLQQTGRAGGSTLVTQFLGIFNVLDVLQAEDAES